MRVSVSPRRPSLLSNTSSTKAWPTGLRPVEPLKITSAMESPRRFFAELSPITQRTASITLDLPQPLGPTMPTRLLGRGTVVGSTKDLNPYNLIFFSRIASLLNVKFHAGLHGRARIRYLIRPFVIESLACPDSYTHLRAH